MTHALSSPAQKQSERASVYVYDFNKLNQPVYNAITLSTKVSYSK